MFIILLCYEHNLSISHHFINLHLLLFCRSHYQLECTWNTKKCRYLIMDVSLSRVFWNRRLAWAIYCLSFLNLKLYSNGNHALCRQPTILDSLNTRKTWGSSLKSFKIKILVINRKFRTLESISDRLSQRLKSHHWKKNKISCLFYVFSLCRSINWFLQLCKESQINNWQQNITQFSGFLLLCSDLLLLLYQ